MEAGFKWNQPEPEGPAFPTHCHPGVPSSSPLMDSPSSRVAGSEERPLAPGPSSAHVLPWTSHPTSPSLFFSVCNTGHLTCRGLMTPEVCVYCSVYIDGSVCMCACTLMCIISKREASNLPSQRSFLAGKHAAAPLETSGNEVLAPPSASSSSPSQLPGGPRPGKAQQPLAHRNQ